ncbi:indolepyruvate ferredoxin oxidoreductase family protein [Flavisphingomonas formosensis]|uniref:indolepyruvate ferredoxin oxidoreductase family protein n=1 Tax=Flavisphingomonas formosensis TaxID=861534 RepID=UPI001E2A3E82|nr:indolepyruvate ferredoxin oxidoreductase family protein [Sphingomonas formosensis]
MGSNASMQLFREVTLDDKWECNEGRIVINGSQAIVRVLLAQAALDRAAGLRTAGYVTGYRGSPLGGVDNALWSVGKRLKAADIVFQPGVNEDIAATAVRGTQQFDQIAGPKYDGVFAAWYGKGPGVDRSGDALKHGNYTGAHPKGGVVLFYGDDHPGKSSSVAHQSEQALAAHLIPSLYPSDVSELISYGLMSFALSRFSGSWVGVKCVNETAEQTATIDVAFEKFTAVIPADIRADVGAVHIKRGPYNPLGEEQVAHRRLPLIRAFVRANRLDRCVIDASHRQLGIVTAGKAYGDVMAALTLLGLDGAGACEAGISVYKVGCIWPLEPEGVKAFAQGQSTLFVVEEKRAFLEEQIASVLINEAIRPRLIGKYDESRAPLLSQTDPLDVVTVAAAIAGRMEALGLLTDAARDAIGGFSIASAANSVLPLKRAPYFCSGCPHNRSTRTPEGSLSMTGIGCHAMVGFARPDVTLLPTQMGGEGGNWLGLAPFTETKHIFQNLGDGTYYHSGLLAIRAAVASKVNITYKILYNDAVAMTGGQPVDGPISVAQIVRQVDAEGVARIVIVSDNPDAHKRNADIPSTVTIVHRDSLDDIQRELRDTAGCSILIYEQTCAAEKRRRRKRGTFPDPSRRLFISKAVCEGCGDCSVQSTCVSLVPVDTAFGRKRAIDQSSCNKDFSCLNGFCPSFVTVRGAEPRKPDSLPIDEAVFSTLPAPALAPLDRTFNLMVAGIGGTGVITVGAILGMAAHLEGKSMSLFDMTGLSQKNGAVFSHVRIGSGDAAIAGQRVGRGEADMILAFDMVAALAPDSAETIRAGRTHVVVNADVAPTVAFQFDRDLSINPALMLGRLRRAAGESALTTVDASGLALAFLGDSIGTNMFLVGVAAQQGLLPVSTAAIEEAIAMNGVAVAFNIKAFRLGRLYAAEPRRLTDMLEGLSVSQEELPATLDDQVEHHSAHLVAYQDQALADRFRTFVSRVRETERLVSPGDDRLARAFAVNYAKLLAYKDEYEVARLLSSPELRAEIDRTFQKGGRISFNMAPPFLSGRKQNGRPAKREFGRWMLPLLRLLARFRGVRGTMFDPFGFTAERRMERALITEYEQLVERVLSTLSRENYGKAVELLTLAGQIRGYGPVKEEAVLRYRQELAVAESQAGNQNPVAQAA